MDGFWPSYSEKFDANLRASGRSAQVTKIVGLSESVLGTFPDGVFDVIYIDGGHREKEVYDDALQAWRLAKPGATLIFDDYAWRPELPMEERPTRAIDRFLAGA